MRPETLQVVLRPRGGWEAVELGCALVRRHARALWWPWLTLSVPVFVLVNALCWWLDQLWLAGVVLWWWLPVFDRIPLYVLSRAVFGQVPGLMQTLRALPDWRRGRLVAHLTWERLNPWRALGLPVDLLEDGNAAAKCARRRQVLHGQRGHGLLLMALCVAFVLVLMLAVVLGVLLFVPVELMSESARMMWETLAKSPPRWAQVVLNALWWLGLSVIEPFHIGAGFGLYLNRRVHLEGWDIELALRRLRARLSSGAGAALLAVCLLLAGALLPGAARAQADDEARTTLADVFGDAPLAEVQAFVAAAETAAQDPLLNQQQTRQQWIARSEQKLDERAPPAWQAQWEDWVQRLARAGEIALWVVLAALVALLVWTAPRWWPWMRAARKRHVRAPAPISISTLSDKVQDLPPDLVAHARRLWQAGEHRRALALLYRGSLSALGADAGSALPGSATEGECLHLAQRVLAPAQHAVFVQLVMVWQRAAYAGRWPQTAEFEALGGMLAQRFGWPP